MFNFYGLLVGIAIVIGWSIAELEYRRKYSQTEFSRLAMLFAAGAFAGGRLWHVLTDYVLYVHNFWRVWQVNQGGLSIWGAIWGGTMLVGLGFLLRGKKPDLVLHFFDSLAVSLPIAQAIGRLGNWYNQELYGLPTDLPWAITISPQHRLAGFAEVAQYHPLFAYEMIGLVVIWALVRRLPPQRPSGHRFVTYLVSYTFLRFCLDFLRLDQTMLSTTTLSLNQVLSVLLLLAVAVLIKLNYKKYHVS